MSIRIAELTLNSQVVFYYLRDNPGSTRQEIGEYLAMSPAELRDALAQLQEHGFLAYGSLAPTLAEQRAYVGAIDRMRVSQRATLRGPGLLEAADAQQSDGPLAHNHEQDDPAQAQGHRVRAT